MRGTKEGILCEHYDLLTNAASASMMIHIAMIQTLSIAGAIVSLYALRVKRGVMRDNGYHPLCDIRTNISCTKALLSKEGSIAGFPNPLIGLMVYPAIFLLTLFYLPAVFFIALALAVASLYLAYVSYIRQKNFCLVCTMIYLINVLLLITSLRL